MELVSNAFKEAAKADERETRALVEFIVNNTPYASGTTVSSNSEAEISSKDSIIESIHFTDKIASFEKGRFLLDGNYFLPVRDEKYCWWSASISKEDKTFDTNPYVEITMPSPTYVNKITVLFCQEEYAEEYKVILDGTTTITIDNGDNIIEIDDTITTIKVEVVKWFQPYWRAKIMAVDLGITKLYNDDDIVDINLVERLDPMCLDIPSNNVSVTVENIAGEFDILNPQGFYEDLTENAPVNIKMGYVTDNGVQMVDMGRFELDTYEQKDNQLVLNANDIINRLDQIPFYGWGKSPITGWDGLDDLGLEPFPGMAGNYTIKQTIDRLMGKVGITNYNIADELDTIDYTNLQPVGWSSQTKFQSARDLLKKIAIYYGCNVWVDRKGTIQFGYVDDNATPYFGPKIETGQEIDIENSYKFPVAEETEQLYKINYYFEGWDGQFDYKKIVDFDTYTVTSGSDIVIPLTEYASEHAFFTLDMSFNPEVVKTGSANWTDIIVYDYKIVIKTTGTGTLSFAIEDMIINTSSEANRTIFNSNLKRGYELDLYFSRIVDAPFTYFFQSEILDWLFNKSKKFEYSCDWRQDLTNNIGDIVKLETKYGVDKYMIITEQQYKYNGALSGYTKGVGN